MGTGHPAPDDVSSDSTNRARYISEFSLRPTVGDCNKSSAADAVDLNDLLSAVDVPQRYEEIEECGRGGLGRVLLVRDRLLGRDIALKEQLATQPPECFLESTPTATIPDATPTSSAYAARFVREAQVTGQLEHPSIVPVYELGRRSDGRLYYTMRLIQGRTFQQAIAEAGSLTARLELLAHFLDACHAIAYSHSRGVIHRDIKPSNIMIGRYGETLVIDWGIAKITDRWEAGQEKPVARDPSDSLMEVDGGLTRGDWMLGTPHYAPPEQTAGRMERVDERSDVYALGSVLYEVLTGRRPFEGDSVDDLVAKAFDASPKPINSLEPKAPAELVAICERAMAKAPADRYQTADALAQDARRFQTGSLVAAYQYTMTERIARFVRRHRVWLSVATAIGAISLISATAFMSALLREQARTEVALYNTSITLAQNALQNRRLYEARTALDGAPTSLRHWEWGLMHRFAHPAYTRLKGHTASVRDAAFSPDGTVAATVSGDGDLRVWDAYTGSLQFTVQGHEGGADAITFTPEGACVVFSDVAGGIHIWDMENRSETLAFHAHDGPITALDISADGRYVGTGGHDGMVRLWHLKTGALVWASSAHHSRVLGLDFGADGMHMTTGGQDNLARMWDVATGQELRIFRDHTNAVEAVSLNPDGTRVATGSWDNTVRIWDAATGTALQVFRGHTAYVTEVIFTRDSAQVVSASEDRSVRVWDVERGREMLVLDGFARPLNFLELAPDEKRVLVATEANEAGIVTLGASEPYMTLKGHTGPVNTIDFSTDGARVCTGGGHWSEANDNRSIVWATDTGTIHRTLAADSGPVNAVRFLSDGNRIAAGSADGMVRIWDVEAGVVVAQLSGHTDQVRSLALDSKCNRLASAGWDDRAFLWDIALQKPIAEFTGHNANIDSVAVVSTRDWVITGGRDGRAVVWDIGSGNAVDSLRVDAAWVWCIAISPDERTIALGDADGGTTLWDRDSLRRVRTLNGHTSRTSTLAFSPDGRRLASGGKDGMVRIWDPATGRELLWLDNHRDRVKAAVFSPDGLTLATGGYDMTAILWTADPWTPTVTNGPETAGLRRGARRGRSR